MKKFGIFVLAFSLIAGSASAYQFAYDPVTKRVLPVTGTPSGAAGTGAVNAGNIKAFAYYPANGTTVDDQAVLYLDGANVGIGTTSTDWKLNVVAPDASSEIFCTDDTAYCTYSIGMTTGGEDIAGYALGGHTSDDPDVLFFFNRTAGGSMQFQPTDSVTALTLATGGNVGIGTDAPDHSLVVYGTSAVDGTYVDLVNTSAAGFSEMDFTVNGSTGLLFQTGPSQGNTDFFNVPDEFVVAGFEAGGLSLLVDYASPIRFVLGGHAFTDEKMRISPAGNVGIGSTAPAAALDLGTTGNLKIFAQKATTGTRYLCINTTGQVTSSATACSGT